MFGSEKGIKDRLDVKDNKISVGKEWMRCQACLREFFLILWLGFVLWCVEEIVFLSEEENNVCHVIYIF